MQEHQKTGIRLEIRPEEIAVPRKQVRQHRPSQIDMDGIRSVIQLRETAGLMKPPVPKAEKYVDERFYKKALASIDK